MTAQASLIPEIDAALRRGPPQRRVETLDRITDLLLADADRLSDEQVALFDDVIGRLIVGIEPEALANLSQRLAPVANAPVAVVRSLARQDDITIAGPVLAQSKRLEDADLVDIACVQGPAHLAAIARRDELDETVTDVLVRRGDHEVVRTMVNNEAARLSETGVAALIERAGRDDVLAVQVGRRADIPAPLLCRLLTHETGAVEARRLATARPERQAEIRRAQSKPADEVGVHGAQPRDHSAAREHAAALERAGRLREDEVMQVARAGRLSDTVAALAALARVPIDLVERLVVGGRPDAVLVLCKAMKFRWATVAAVLSLRFAPQSPTIEAAEAQYERQSVATARQVLHFWQTRPAQTAENA
jgi:uncharacterized protein (DUF2336 family)